jgi:uncharacterized repeat protein (TIGR03803 family)
MGTLTLIRYVCGVGAAAAVLTACAGSQPLVTPESAATTRTVRHEIASTPSYRVVYRFLGGSDGAYPYSDLINVNGSLYGTTYSGGGTNGAGTVFRLTTSGDENVVYRFAGGSDGAHPEAGLVSVHGVLYGTTTGGGSGCGTGGCGTVFSVTTSGAEQVLHRFAGGADGASPEAGLVSLNGTLYGTTTVGGSGCGSGGCGTVFSVTPSGAENVVYRFAGGPSDGAYPHAALINVNRKLYGTTQYGGSGSGPGRGIVFSLTAGGTERVLYRFAGATDGAFPQAGLLATNGILYGTTEHGGSKRKEYTCGTVFSVTMGRTEKVLYSFGCHPDAQNPVAGLIRLGKTLYGTTLYGGEEGGLDGTLYSLTKAGVETVLHSFRFGHDGGQPQAGLVNRNGTLYGTTSRGGVHGCSDNKGCGTIFTFTP